MDRATYSDDLRKVAKGAGTTFLGKLVGGGLHYFYNVLIARILGAELFGLFFLGLTVINIAGVASKLGLDNGTVRFVALYQGASDKKRVKGTIVQALKISTISSLVVSGVVFGLSGFIAEGIFNRPALVPVIKILSLSLPFWTVMIIALFSTQAFQIMKYNVYVQNIFIPLVWMILTLFAFSMGFQLFGVIWAYVISMIFGMGLALVFLNKVFPEFRSRNSSVTDPIKLLKYSSPLMLVGILNFSLLWIDILMLGYFKGNAEVGVYSMAVKTALLTIIILTAFNSIFAPIMSDLFHKRHMDRLGMLFKTITKWIFMFSFSYFLLIALLAEEVMSLFGAEFAVGSVCLIILTFSQLINGSTGSVNYMLTMSGKQNVALVNQIFTVILNVMLNLWLIPKWGIVGAAIATGVSLSLINILALIEVYYFYRLHPYHMEFLKPLAAGAIAFTVGFFLKSQVSLLGNGLTLVTIMTSFLLIYALLIYVMGLSSEDNIILDRVKDRLFPNKNFGVGL